MTRILDPFVVLSVVEGISGTWFYHLSKDGKTGHPALCGNKQVMSTSFPVRHWGFVGHLKERYCPDCEKVALAEGYWKGQEL